VQSIATQAAETRSRWAWVEPAVWTDRMLAALETGVKGGLWRWPNAFFRDAGLFSLVEAHTALRQSLKR
jgi:hypothetical protein